MSRGLAPQPALGRDYFFHELPPLETLPCAFNQSSRSFVFNETAYAEQAARCHQLGETPPCVFVGQWHYDVHPAYLAWILPLLHGHLCQIVVAAFPASKVSEHAFSNTYYVQLLDDSFQESDVLNRFFKRLRFCSLSSGGIGVCIARTELGVAYLDAMSSGRHHPRYPLVVQQCSFCERGLVKQRAVEAYNAINSAQWSPAPPPLQFNSWTGLFFQPGARPSYLSPRTSDDNGPQW